MVAFCRCRVIVVQVRSQAFNGRKMKRKYLVQHFLSWLYHLYRKITRADIHVACLIMLALSTHVLLMFVLQNRKPKVESRFKINNVNLDMFVGCLVRVPFLYRRFFSGSDKSNKKWLRRKYRHVQKLQQNRKCNACNSLFQKNAPHLGRKCMVQIPARNTN